MSIQKLIETAEFGEMFVTRDHSRALFLRRCDDSGYKTAEFYVEDWGIIRVDSTTGHVLSNDIVETYGFNDIVGKA